jgi:hypothetical protein
MNKNIIKVLFLVLPAMLVACAKPPLVLDSQLVETTNCAITLEDNRMNKNMIDQKGDLPMVIGYLQFPFPLSPSVHDLTLNRICSIKQIASKPIKFELEKFYCDWKSRFTYAVGVFELELSYLDENKKRQRIFARKRVDYNEDLGLYDICGGAIKEAFKELPETINQQIKL